MLRRPVLLTAALQTLGPRLAKWGEAMSLACGTSDLPTSISDAYERDAARGVLKTRQNQTRLTPSSLRRGLEDGLPSNSAEALGAAVLAARPDLGKMLDAKGQYAGFELSLVDPKTGRPMNPDDADAVPHDAKMELVLSKGYAVRAFAPVRKYVVGRFSGERPPKFKSGRATAVEWQLCRQRSDVTGREPNLQLVSESKKGGRVQFNGARESAGLGNFFLLMMQASTTDVCAIPMEQWYNFRPVANRRVMSLEEAEERLEARGRHTTSTSQWLEKVS